VAMPSWHRLTLSGVLALLGALTPGAAAAQLISPGRLSSAHAALEGIRNCTQCHELRKPGISPALCLSCHEPLARRIRAEEGFHASLAVKDCASCHKEHFGADFQLVRLDTASFDHARTGFELKGEHARQGCRDCHKPALVSDPDVRAFKQKHGALDRTYLGLPTECASCHREDSPHGTQFVGRACSQCHDAGGWKGAHEFDHDRAPFRLTGAHRRVACTKCHAATPRNGSDVPYVRYTGIASGKCNDCHEDPHRGAMKGACSSCHETSGWRNVNRTRLEASFDHASTGFTLVGHHTRIPCASCHDAGAAASLAGIHIRFRPGTRGHTFPSPESGTCLACHQDAHDGVFAKRPGAGDCRSCHGQDAWLPADYDAARHNREASFKLEGAHLAVACDACHARGGRDKPDFHVDASKCASCHQVTNPHGDQFEGRDCDACHTVDSFRITHFDHDRTRFPLRGAHPTAPCSACHKPEKTPSGGTMIRYRPLGTKCLDCHGGKQ